MVRLTRIAPTALVVVASCAADPTAVQKFAQSTPPTAQFNALLLDYPGLLTQEPLINSIAIQAKAALATPPDAVTFCSSIRSLSQLHLSMIAYMKALGAAAAAGTALKSTGADGGDAPTQSAMSASPDTSPPLTECPPATMPVIAQASPAPTAANADTPQAKMGAQAPTASTLSKDLENVGKIKGLSITKADADAASSLIVLIEDAATTYMREQAVGNALRQGHDSFLAALAIEKTVIGFVATTAGNYAGDVKSDVSGVFNSVGQGTPKSQRAALDVAARILIKLSPTGPITNPQQAVEIQSAANAYVNALSKLEVAYIKLYDTSTSGAKVLKPATWTAIQPLLTDVANSYAALSKL